MSSTGQDVPTSSVAMVSDDVNVDHDESNDDSNDDSLHVLHNDTLSMSGTVSFNGMELNAINDTRHIINHRFEIGGSVFETSLLLISNELGQLSCINMGASSSDTCARFEVACTSNDQHMYLSTSSIAPSSKFLKTYPKMRVLDAYSNPSLSPQLNDTGDRYVRQINTYLRQVLSDETGLSLLPHTEFNFISGDFHNMTQLLITHDVLTIFKLGGSVNSSYPLSFLEFVTNIYKDRAKADLLKRPEEFLRMYILLVYETFLDDLFEQLSVHYNSYVLQLSIRVNMARRFLLAYPSCCIIPTFRSADWALILIEEYNSKLNAWIHVHVGNRNVRSVRNNKLLRYYRLSYRSDYRQLVLELNRNRADRLEANQFLPYPSELHNLLQQMDVPNLPLPTLHGVMDYNENGRYVRSSLDNSMWYSHAMYQVVNFILSGVPNDRLTVDDEDSMSAELRSTQKLAVYEFSLLRVENLLNEVSHNVILAIVDVLILDDWYLENGRLPRDLLIRCVQFCLRESVYFTNQGDPFQLLRGSLHDERDFKFLCALPFDQLLKNHHNSIFLRYMVSNHWLDYDTLFMYAPRGTLVDIKRDIELNSTCTLFVPSNQISHHSLNTSDSYSGRQVKFMNHQIFDTNGSNRVETMVEPWRTVRISYFVHVSSNDQCRRVQRNLVRQYVDGIVWQTTNNMLMLNLIQLNEYLYHHGYPSCFIIPIICRSLTSARNIIQGIARDMPVMGFQKYFSLGNLEERVTIINQYIKMHQPELAITRDTDRVYMITDTHPYPLAPGLNFSRYVCEDASLAIVRIFRELGLNTPTCDNGDDFFVALRYVLGLSSLVVSAHISTYIIRCDNCPTAFFISGTEPLSVMYNSCLVKKDTPINIHMCGTGHTSSIPSVALKCRFTPDIILPDSLVSIMEQILQQTLGHLCPSVRGVYDILRYTHNGAIMLIEN